MGSIEQRVEQLEREQIIQKEDLLRLRQLNEQQLQEASKVLGESRLAQEWARRQYRVDHDGWIWRWDLDRKTYVKTTNRVNTPVIPYNKITTKHLVDKTVTTEKIADDAVTLEKLSNEVRAILANIHNFGTVIVDSLPTADALTYHKLYLLRHITREEETETLQTLACNYDTVNEHDEIHDSTMPEHKCFKIDVVEDAVRIDFSGDPSTLFTIRAIVNDGDVLRICSNKKTGVSLEELADCINKNNHDIAGFDWAADADYVYAWIEDTPTEDALTVEKIISSKTTTSYEKFVTITDGVNYEWFDLGPTGPMPIEPTSSAEALWNNETVATNGLINEDWMETYHGFVITNLALKQAVLQNQVNIKSINGQSLLGSGNINIDTTVFEFANTLPNPDTAAKNRIYLIPSSDPDAAAQNIKDEYVAVPRTVIYNDVQYPVTLMDSEEIRNVVVLGYMAPVPDASAANEGTMYLHQTNTPPSTTDRINTDGSLILSKEVYTNVFSNVNQDVKIGDAYTVASGVNAGIWIRTKTGTNVGWVKVETYYVWELIGSTRINLEDYYTKEEIAALLGGASYAVDANNRLIVTKGTARYFAQLTELVKPEAPSITGSTAFNIVINNSIQPATINISKPEGSTAYYRTSSGGSWGEWIAITGTSFTLSSGFANDGTAAEKQVSIQLKSILNGEESNYASATITFKPKIAPVTFGSPSGSEYDKTRTITVTPSATAGLGSNTSHYKIGSGSDVNINTATTVTLTASGYNQSMTLYGSVDAKTGWVNADGSNSGAIKIGTPKIYWAVMSSLPTTNGEVEAMTNALSQKNFPTVTLPNSGVQGKYLVLAYNYTAVGNKNVTSVKDQNNLSYTFHIETVGDFKLCVVDNLAASAAGLKFTFA